MSHYNGTSNASHDECTVAWICALPLEMAAAKAMLDDIHGRLPQPSTDHNAHTLGKVHGHNVVIAYLSSGIYGTMSATTAISLMVGIGGGVPQKTDVHL
ncbi:hypothetical protein BGW36DRAFT_381126 [Talaromyces proteolyticus]|uniref:Uncharacterized protein n=1 Tax=Talaromyces proteolyticus TaxID=1131652 RepID=A0AAD4Q000_9EURO|nr:uncharacterized protein BGW36DRAFT_381126 [Talaromyces proteolyticus]KAH8696501.1 hypothetical protein BGW36DRAFT_381126 [Talaromyces proteolyticus]